MSDQHTTGDSRQRLLVPMNIEALVLGKIPQGTQWANRVPAFKGIYFNQFLGRQLETEGWTDPVTDLYDKPGVYLHWALPDGLTHGITADNGREPEFSMIPNRWLIVRFWDQGGETRELDFKFKAWIIESDTVTDDTDAVVWPNLHSEKPDPQKASDYYAYVGKEFDLDQWPAETDPSRVDITAVGYGETAFAAYYPACRGILGFHDKYLADLPGNVTLSYFVAGWYSAAAKDPLVAGLTEKTIEALAEILDERKWTYPGWTEALAKAKEAEDLAERIKEANEMSARLQDARDHFDDTRPVFANTQALKDDLLKGQAELQKKITDMENKRRVVVPDLAAVQKDLPDRILCHGVLGGVRWQGETHSYDSGVPRGKPFSVAVGNTAVEALGALFKDKLNSDLVRLLEVFQYGLLAELEKPGGRAGVDHKIHARTFKPLARGIHWDLIHETPQQPGESAVDQSPADEQSAPIPGDIRLLLENLNKHQREINRLRRERASVQSELYATWYKRVLNAEAQAVGEDILIQRLADLQKDIGSLTEDIEKMEDAATQRPSGAEWDQLQEKLSSFLPGFNLQRLDEPRFWRPNDPVVLMAGRPFQRSSRHGEDGRFRSDGRLLCRLSSQEITRLKITVPHAKKEVVEFGPADLDQWCRPFPAKINAAIPAEVVNLFREALFLILLLPALHQTADQAVISKKLAQAVAAAAYEKNEPGLAKDRPEDVEKLAQDLIESYLVKVWEDACNPDIEDPDLRHQDRQTVWEFVGRFPSPVVLTGWDKNPWLPLFLQWQVSWVPSYKEAPEVLQNWQLTDRGTAFKWQGQNPGPQDEKFIYTDTTLLTPSAAFTFSDRLRRYNLTHDNRKLKELQTAAGRMNLLCQSLGGFTENLLTRQAFLELKPLEPGKDDVGPQFSSIFEAVKDIDWLSPLIDKKFFPVRAGHLKLEKLWIIDAFGQLLKLEDPAEGDKEKVDHPLLPAGLAGSDGYMRLEPRLNQPARLTVEWLDAGRGEATGENSSSIGEDEEFNPVCGWILPNFLDKALMIYDARGYALGSLQTVQRKSWREGVGSELKEIESFHWVDIPGSESFFYGRAPQTITDPLGEKANPHLRAFVKGLLLLSEGKGQAFARLLENMNNTLSAGGNAGTGQNPNLALLIGKPLALVRASLRLELDGRMALAQGWDDLKAEQTAGIEKAKFPIRLGDRQKLHNLWLSEDGLVGYFLNSDYSRFFPAFGLEGRNDDYSRYQMVPQISVAQPLDLTLLMDPSRGICATTGILPRKIFNLPYGDITETLENKQIVFFTGPIVGTENTERTGDKIRVKMRMPQPSDVYGQWSWTHHPAVKVWREADITDSQKEQGQFFDDGPRITEGWLKLITAPLEIRVFKVKGIEPVKEKEQPPENGTPDQPDRFEISSGKEVILSWSVIGAEAIELKQGSLSLFKSGRQPLPVQYRVPVDRDESFTLIAFGRPPKSSDSEAQRTITKAKTIEIAVVPAKAERNET